MRSIEDLKTWLESAMDDSMSRKTTMEFVARVVEDARDQEREACATLLDVKAATKLKANNRDATMALMDGANEIRARGDK